MFLINRNIDEVQVVDIWNYRICTDEEKQLWHTFIFNVQFEQ